MLGQTITGALANIPFPFGIDVQGNYGYRKDGADTVTPFKSGGVDWSSITFTPLVWTGVQGRGYYTFSGTNILSRVFMYYSGAVGANNSSPGVVIVDHGHEIIVPATHSTTWRGYAYTTSITDNSMQFYATYTSELAMVEIIDS